MAVSIYVNKRLDVTVGEDTYPTVILGFTMKNSSDLSEEYELVQTSALTSAGISTRPYGMVVIPNKVGTTELTFVLKNLKTKALITMTATAINSIVRGATIAVAG